MVKKLKTYSLVAGTIIGVTHNIKGAIQYTDVNPDSIITTLVSPYLLDLNGDLITDFKFEVGSGVTCSSASVKCTYTNWVKANGFTTTNSVVFTTYIYPWLNSAIALSSESLINSMAKFISGSVTMAIEVTIGFSATRGYFIGQTDKYVGLKFKIGANTHYGWMLVDVSSTADTLIIKSYAYNDVPNQSINAGEGIFVGVDEKELNNVSIYGYNNQIHISASRGTATIFNLQGQRVHQSKLTGKTSISLDKGIYLVRVMEDGRSVTKKVYLN